MHAFFAHANWTLVSELVLNMNGYAFSTQYHNSHVPEFSFHFIHITEFYFYIIHVAELTFHIIHVTECN